MRNTTCIYCRKREPVPIFASDFIEISIGRYPDKMTMQIKAPDKTIKDETNIQCCPKCNSGIR